MSTDIKEVVKEKYGQAALRVHIRAAVRAAVLRPRWRAVAIPSRPTCTTRAKASQIPEDALKASLGCGNPTALAQLNPGETVLDLGLGRRH